MRLDLGYKIVVRNFFVAQTQAEQCNFQRLTKPNCTPFATAPRLIGIENHIIEDKMRLEFGYKIVVRNFFVAQIQAEQSQFPTTHQT